MQICVAEYFLSRAKKFDDKATWKANEDGTVNTEGPRVIVGGEGMGMSGGFVTKYVISMAHGNWACCNTPLSSQLLFFVFFDYCNHFVFDLFLFVWQF